MKVSIALCTYNGAFCLLDQLQSISAQSRLPDEVIVCDDGSVDDTHRLIHEWAGSVPFAVHWHRNERNLGATQNFARCLSLCTGDIIFFADQDDAYAPRKLELTLGVFASRPDVGLVFTDGFVTDQDLHPLGRTLWQSCRFGRHEQAMVSAGNAFDVLLRRNVVTSSSLAFRARFRDLVYPIPANPIVFHDEWVALLISAVGTIVGVPEKLMYYRQHPGQKVGAHVPVTTSNVVGVIGRNAQHDSRLVAQEMMNWLSDARDRLAIYDLDPSRKARITAALDMKIDHLSVRAKMPRGRIRRVRTVLGEWTSLCYHRYSSGWRQAVKDMIAT